jgi:outer membrane protein assembly factor BamA
MHLRLTLAALFAALVTPYIANSGPQECENASSRPINPVQQVKIAISSVEFPIDDNLSDELRTKLRRNLEQKQFSVATGEPDTEWLDELNEVVVRDVLANAGYFKAQPRTTPYLIRAEADQQFYAVRIEAKSGPLYRLGEIQFANATVFAKDNLRKLVRLMPGEPFDLSRIREAIESIARLYSTKGYIDATVEPRMDIDDDKGQINLTMLVTEEAQYRVGTVEILGLKNGARNRLMDRLETGLVFDASVLQGFLDENERNVSFHRYTQDRTADIVLDVRKRDCVDGASPGRRPLFEYPRILAPPPM